MAKEKNKGKSMAEIATLLGIGQLNSHLLLCTGPDCCSEEEGEAAWKALKAKIKTIYPRLPETKMYRTRVKCLRFCQNGPVAVVYPQGKWFQGVTAERVDEIVDYLLTGNAEPHPLEFRAAPLSPDS